MNKCAEPGPGFSVMRQGVVETVLVIKNFVVEARNEKNLLP